MAKNYLRSEQMRDGEAVKRADLCVAGGTGTNVIAKIIQGAGGIEITSTGGESGTGDVTINLAGAANIAVTNDTTTNATMYPVWVAASSGNQVPKVSSTKLSFNPSTGVLSTIVVIASTAVGIGTATPNYMLSFGTALYTSGSKVALYENGADLYGFGVTSGSVDFYAGGSLAAAFRNASHGYSAITFGLSIGASFTGTASPANGLLVQGGVMLGAEGSPGAGNIGLMAIPSTALDTNYAGLLIGNTGLIADKAIGTSKRFYLSQNAILGAGGVWKYVSTEAATIYSQSSYEGSHDFGCAPPGTAGATVSLTSVLSLNALHIGAFVPFTLANYTVAALPVGGEANQGDTAFVNDANERDFRELVTGGGSETVPVYYDGTDWRVG